MSEFFEDITELKKLTDQVASQPIDAQYDKHLFNMGESSAEQKLELDKTVYRVMKMEHFLKWCEEGKNVLPSVDKWDDPWERALFKSPVHYKDDDYIDVNTFKFYGQCWSFDEKETDATWRIFKANEGGCVRIGIRAGDLFDALKSFVGDAANISCYAGKVEYADEQRVKDFFEQTSFADRLTSSGDELALTLFIKRNAFEHEKEFRVVYYPTEDGDVPMPMPDDNGLFKYDLPINKIKHVTIGPEISHCIHEKKNVEFKCAELIKKMRSKGVTCSIDRSEIYDFPVLNVSY